MARAIDADSLLNEAEYDSNFRLIIPADKVKNAPTLTPPSEWISVKDRLPEEVVDVLILVEERYPVCPGRDGVYRWIFTGWIVEDSWETVYCHGRYSLVEQMERELGTSYVVTHWMPLPAPPKEG